VERPLPDLTDLGRRAQVFGMPTIDLYRILDSFALDPSSPEFKAPVGQFAHSRRLADPSDRSIVAMNVDTPYSYAWLDLRDEPVVLTLPAFEPDRYVAAELFDLYTYIVGYVSPRTNGTSGGSFLITGPGQSAGDTDLPVFACPTQLCLVLVRTQLLGDADLPNVVALQDQMSVQPLADWLGREYRSSTPTPGLDPIPPVDVRARPTVQALRVLAWMLRFMPTLPEHAEVRSALATVGIGGGDPTALDEVLADPGRVAQLEAGLDAGLDDVLARARGVRSSAEIFGSREQLGHDDLSRAAGAYLGILGNAAEEYLGVGYQADAHGRPLVGSTAYTITFPPGGLPPVDAFWSITLYDADRFLYPNALNRYLLGSRDLPQMHRAEDGTLTLVLQHAAPQESLLTNWLPCPAGLFHLAFRTYQPGEAIRTGAWEAPPVIPGEPL
jgi:hypothetical protein